MGEQPEIQTLLRECLARRFPLYEKKHVIHTSDINLNQIYVSYDTEEISGSDRYLTTHLDLNIIGNTCFIGSIAVVSEKIGKGFGRALYATAEEFALLYGSTFIQTSPSGLTRTRKTRFEYSNQVFNLYSFCFIYI